MREPRTPGAVAVIQRLGEDTCILVFGTRRLTFRLGELEMLLDPQPEVRVERVALMRTRDEANGDLTLSKTKRTLLARVTDPPRLFAASVDKTRAFLQGTLGQLKLTDMTDDHTAPARLQGAESREERVHRLRELAMRTQRRLSSGAAPAAPAAAPPRAPVEPTPRVDRSRVARAPATALEDVLDGIHACPSGLTCRPGGGVCYPAAARGKPAGVPLDVLFVHWNPRTREYASGEMPALDRWKAEAASALARAAREDAPWARAMQSVLPDGVRVDDGTVMQTWIWKWPTRVPARGEAADFYVQRCVTKHFHDELAALKPRVIVTLDKLAAAWFTEQARERELRVDVPPPGVRSGSVAGRVDTRGKWGWPLDLVLLKDVTEPAVAAWVQRTIASALSQGKAPP